MERLEQFAAELQQHLQTTILPFWIDRMQDGRGGFHGRITGAGELVADAPRGAILYGRILWTFSAAYRVLRNPEYLEVAARAKNWLLEHFYDRQYGGVYWEVAADGTPLDMHKQFYALGFAIYGLSEYHRATGDREALEYAVQLFEAIEAHAFDRRYNGYVEAAGRDWTPVSDMRLSDKDDNEPKSMNTHLHILEPYTNLYRVWPDERLRDRLVNLLEVFLDRIESPETHHLGLFFDDEWNEKSQGCFSYGHDIEASWLLLEAAQTVGDPVLTERVKHHCRMIATAALEGYLPDGSMIYEHHADGTLDEERHWWVQAECVVGLTWLHLYHHDAGALGKAVRTWEYIRTHLVDSEAGEWFWSIRADGTVNRTDDKAGFWKCPYHNSRMCLEVMACAKAEKDPAEV